MGTNEAVRARERAVAVEAVRLACRLCENVAAEMEPGRVEKPDRSPVTIADFGSQAIICRAIGDAFPADPVMAEEDAALFAGGARPDILAAVVRHVERIAPGADADGVCGALARGGLDRFAERFWVLDPIDGTKGFLRGDQYAVALALMDGGDVVLAVLGCPRLTCSHDATDVGVLFVAERGAGATQQSLTRDGPARPARVSGTRDVRDARLCEPVESAHSRHSAAAALADHLGMRKPPARLDSQAKYGVVARGEGDVYLRLPRQPGRSENLWDHAPGVLVVEEAGGRVTDARGRRLRLEAGTKLVGNEGILVTNGLVHDAVLRAIEELELLPAGA